MAWPVSLVKTATNGAEILKKMGLSHMANEASAGTSSQELQQPSGTPADKVVPFKPREP